MLRLLVNLAVAAGLFGAMAPGLAEDTIPGWAQAMNNLSHEYSNCAAYFAIVSVAMENSDSPETAAQYSDASSLALQYSIRFASEAGLLPETVASRYGMAIRSMSDRIALNTSNISILGADYMQPCQVAMEDTNSRILHWLGFDGATE